MINYVTFGQDHRHVIGDKVFDKDCVATYDSKDYASGRQKAFDTFGDKFCFHYYGEEEKPDMSWFPRGLLALIILLATMSGCSSEWKQTPAYYRGESALDPAYYDAYYATPGKDAQNQDINRGNQGWR